MSSSVVVPLGQRERRVHEMGRIRLGDKKGTGRDKRRKLSKFRLTSVDQAALTQLAAVYGGDVVPWFDEKASPKHQFELYTEATELRVWLPADPLKQHYELWGGKGNARRCDGITATVPRGDGEAQVPCPCAEKQVLECALHSRLIVILPDCRMGGVWRLESKGEAAADELPAMVDLVMAMQQSSLVGARLSLEERQSRGGSRQFVVPVLTVDETPERLLGGQSGIAALPGVSSEQLALERAIDGLDDVPVLAEVVDDEQEKWEAGTKAMRAEVLCQDMWEAGMFPDGWAPETVCEWATARWGEQVEVKLQQVCDRKARIVERDGVLDAVRGTG